MEKVRRVASKISTTLYYYSSKDMKRIFFEINLKKHCTLGPRENAGLASLALLFGPFYLMHGGPPKLKYLVK